MPRSTGNQIGLKSFIEDNGRRPEIVPGAIGRIEPFFQIAKDGSYRLRPYVELDKEKVAAAIELGTGREVTGVDLVSSTNLFLAKHLIRDAIYEGNLECSLASCLSERFKTGLWSADDRWFLLRDGLWSALRASLGESLESRLWPNLRTSLYFFLDAALVGDRTKMELLAPLIELLPDTVPIGELRDCPGTWLSLCA